MATKGKGKDLSEKLLEQYNDVFADIVNGIVFSVCSTKPLPKSRTTLDTRGERLRCFEFDEMDGI